MCRSCVWRLVRLGEIRLLELLTCSMLTILSLVGMQPPGQISGMTGSLKFTHMGSAIVHQVRTGMSCELDLREPSLLSMGKKHQVDTSLPFVFQHDTP